MRHRTPDIIDKGSAVAPAGGLFRRVGGIAWVRKAQGVLGIHRMRGLLVRGMAVLSVVAGLQLMGCTADNAELFANDLKHFIFSGGLFRAEAEDDLMLKEAAEEPLEGDEELSEVDAPDIG